MQESEYDEAIDALNRFIQQQDEKITLRPAAEKDLRYLQQNNYPASVCAFYAQAEPSFDLESEGVYLVPIQRLVVANSEAVPGLITKPLGLPVIAQTISGDTYCLNLHQQKNGECPVYLVAHDQFGLGTDLATILSASHRITNTFRAFIMRFCEEELPYDISHAHHF